MRQSSYGKSELRQGRSLKRKFLYWKSELRAPFLTATVVSIVLGTTIAWTRNGVFYPEYFSLALLGGIFLHLGTNVANDYFDHKSGNDEVNKDFVRPFSGGSRMIQLGLLTPSEVLFGALVFYTLGTLIGLYLTLTRGFLILLLGIVGLLSGFFYTAPPLNWASRGMGEALVGLNFGTLMSLGAYYVQTQTITAEPALASIPVSLLIAAVLYINEFPDYNADKTVGKKTLVVRLGRERAVYGYITMMISVYVTILLCVLFSVIPVYALIGFATLPFAKVAIKCSLKHHSDPPGLVPANALTILCHLLTGLLLSVGYLTESLARWDWRVSVLIACMSVLFTVYLYVRTFPRR
jgi:1,4-dihydroxy-2-naphthoate octaprenyltransferase